MQFFAHVFICVSHPTWDDDHPLKSRWSFVARSVADTASSNLVSGNLQNVHHVTPMGHIYISLYITIYQSNMFNWKQDRTNKSKHCSTLSCLRFFCVGAARHGLPSNLRRRPAFAARSHRRPWRRHQPWPTLKTPCRNSWSCWRWNCFRRMTWYVVTFYGCWCGHLRGEIRGE